MRVPLTKEVIPYHVECHKNNCQEKGSGVEVGILPDSCSSSCMYAHVSCSTGWWGQGSPSLSNWSFVVCCSEMMKGRKERKRETKQKGGRMKYKKGKRVGPFMSFWKFMDFQKARPRGVWRVYDCGQGRNPYTMATSTIFSIRVGYGLPLLKDVWECLSIQAVVKCGPFEMLLVSDGFGMSVRRSLDIIGIYYGWTRLETNPRCFLLQRKLSLNKVATISDIAN